MNDVVLLIDTIKDMISHEINDAIDKSESTVRLERLYWEVDKLTRTQTRQ